MATKREDDPLAPTPTGTSASAAMLVEEVATPEVAEGEQARKRKTTGGGFSASASMLGY